MRNTGDNSTPVVRSSRCLTTQVPHASTAGRVGSTGTVQSDIAFRLRTNTGWHKVKTTPLSDFRIQVDLLGPNLAGATVCTATPGAISQIASLGHPEFTGRPFIGPSMSVSNPIRRHFV
jgi:hypothetical protein